MALFYYDALPKDERVDADQNLRRSRAVMRRTRNMLTPFYQYLATAIKTLKNKTDIKARWRKVHEPGLVKLEPLSKLWKIEKLTEIHLLHNQMGVFRIIGDCEQDVDTPIRYKSAGIKGEIVVATEDILGNGLIRLKDAPHTFDNVVWGYDTIQLEPAWLVLSPGARLDDGKTQYTVKAVNASEISLLGSLPDNATLAYQNHPVTYRKTKATQIPAGLKTLFENHESAIILSDKKPEGATEVKIEPYLDDEHLQWEHDHQPFKGEKHDSGRLAFSGDDLQKGIGKVVINPNGLRFKVVAAGGDHQLRYWIQLLEMDEEPEEDIPGASLLRYFFDDDIDIGDNLGNRYGIDRGREGERKLLLYRKPQNGRKEYCHPEGEILNLKVHTYQLDRQKDAVQALQDKPMPGHHGLIKLFEDRNTVEWKRPLHNKTVINWQVLTEEHRNGAKEQREFVSKALATPDFAILEGPPGSGKTTVILELICQLVLQGKRILLCGSTHVAIDNVLERLVKKDLLQQLSILPVRIGDEKRISDAVVEFQINNLIKKSGVDATLLLEASNLVCGTTIGILQHPDMKQFEARWEEKAKMPITPQFDYLIIDECSKTTFQEFLVPALYAKHWILVGDVRQLSPFTDREQLVSNIQQMPLKENETLPEALQAACLILYKLREMLNREGSDTKYIFVVDQATMDHFAWEWLYLKEVDGLKDKVIGFLSRNTAAMEKARTAFIAQPRKHLPHLILKPKPVDMMAAVAANVLLVEEKIYQQYKDHLPVDAIVVNRAHWSRNSHAFRMASLDTSRIFNPSAKDRGRQLQGAKEIHSYYLELFEERRWADEVAWRIDREHQLRLKDTKATDRISKAIEDLLPKSLGNEGDVANRLNTIAAVALPSILEMLDRGLTKRRPGDSSTLTKGFTPAERQDRRTLLQYQQRMHPEISVFPRGQFYSNQALQDMDKMTQNRAWSFSHYTHRSVWMDVKGKTERNRNSQEVKAMQAALIQFLQWASNNPPPEDGRDNTQEWDVACLTFYRGQETLIREMLQKELKHFGTHNATAFSSFSYQQGNGVKVNIKLHTVDKFQGQEADIVFLSMVQTYRDGFLDSPNRLNVAVTRARYQLVLIGDHTYFSQNSPSDDLKNLAKHHNRQLL